MDTALPSSVWRRLGACLSLTGVLAVVLALPSAARADEAQDFLARFRHAVAQPGAEAITRLTAFPFGFESRPLDEKAFAARAVPALFKPAARRCLQTAKPVAEDGRLLLGCAPYGYVLGPTPAGWRLLEFFVDAP